MPQRDFNLTALHRNADLNKFFLSLKFPASWFFDDCCGNIAKKLKELSLTLSDGREAIESISYSKICKEREQIASKPDESAARAFTFVICRNAVIDAARDEKRYRFQFPKFPAGQAEEVQDDREERSREMEERCKNARAVLQFMLTDPEWGALVGEVYTEVLVNPEVAAKRKARRKARRKVNGKRRRRDAFASRLRQKLKDRGLPKRDAHRSVDDFLSLVRDRFEGFGYHRTD